MKFAVILLAASSSLAQSLTGVWSATVRVNEVLVPFQLGLEAEGANVKGWFFNGDERVLSTRGTLSHGVLTLSFDQYASRLEAIWKDGLLVGSYGRTDRPAYPLEAKPLAASQADAATVPEIAGNWEIPTKSAKGELAWHFLVRQSGPEISATILRVDGDTGVLTGRYDGGKLVLSHFSGARPNLLEVCVENDGSLLLTQNGKTQYKAVRETDARARNLPPPTDPFHHTSVKEADQPFAFRFPDLEGKTVANTDPKFQGKVVVVAISGSWCPNCHDEAPFLEGLYRKYRSQGLEVVALSFEEGEQLKNPARLRAFVQAYGIDYTVLVPGEPDQLHEKVPQAVNLNSWPTTFFLGRDGRVRGVHAGFAGVASGSFHGNQNAEIASLVESLLAEKPLARQGL